MPVPPMSPGQGPTSVDFFQPGGIYRDVRLRVLPQAFLSDVFALPADVLTSQRRVDVECTIDSALTTHADGTLVVELFDGPQLIAVQGTPVSLGTPGVTTMKLSLTGLGPITLWSTGQPEAVHRAGHADRARRGQPRADPADRIPGGLVPAGRLLPERRAAAAVRPEPAPALPVRRHGDAGPGPAQGRGDPEERVQLQHGPLLALPAVAALPRRLRRARAAGLGRGTGLAQREHQPGLAGPGACRTCATW